MWLPAVLPWSVAARPAASAIRSVVLNPGRNAVGPLVSAFPGTCFNSVVEASNSLGDRRQARVTIRQVAERAGVSIATVSRVINGHADVSARTREAVQRVLREHGYQASTRSRQRSTGLVGVAVPMVHPSYFAEILSGAAEALYEHDMQVVLCPTRHSHDREVSLLDRLADGGADGAILVLPEESSEELRELADHGLRFVVVDPRTEVAEGIPVVCAAHSAGAMQATRHLLDLGHRRIGVIGGPRAGSRRRSACAATTRRSRAAVCCQIPLSSGTRISASRAAGKRRPCCLPCRTRPPRSSLSTTAWRSARSRRHQRAACTFPLTCRWQGSTTPVRPRSPCPP